MAEQVGEVKTGHRNLGDGHLEESGERREDTELILVESEPGGCTQIATLHNYKSHLSVTQMTVEDAMTYFQKE